MIESPPYVRNPTLLRALVRVEQHSSLDAFGDVPKWRTNAPSAPVVPFGGERCPFLEVGAEQFVTFLLFQQAPSWRLKQKQCKHAIHQERIHKHKDLSHIV